MIKHYLKVALRNLMNFKVHSLISAICLAIGITCFSMMNYFIDAVAGNIKLSDDNEYSIQLHGASSQTAADIYLFKEDFDYLKGLPIAGIDALVASSSYSNGKEITAIDKKQRELPFLVLFKNVSSNYFTYNSLKLKYGNQEITAPDEVIVSQSFARKAFGKEDPIGQVIRQETEANSPSDFIKVYKIVNVALTEEKDHRGKAIDCYFPLSIKSRTPLSIRSRLIGQTTTESLNKQLKNMTWKHGDQDVNLYASLESEQDGSVQGTMSMLLARFIASLILLSGLINFLKFIIQMFYNRQRELALRKCIGSDIKGLFTLLFAEIFWMLSVAFFLSLAVTEIILSLAYTYIRPDDMISFSLVDLYGSQLVLYLVLLLICMLAILYPIYRLRRLNVLHSIVQRQKRHVFRNFMIALQLAISIFFTGGVFGITLLFDEMFGGMYHPLSAEEENQVISISINTIRMQNNMDAILSDIQSLPEITDRISAFNTFDTDVYTYMTYMKNGNPRGNVLMIQAEPHYFEFFKIPFSGKLVDKDAQGFVYISEQFKEQLQRDSIEGSVTLDGEEYRIAGTYRALNKEGALNRVVGSVFLVNPQAYSYYFKTSHPDITPVALEKITEICRRYVPETLPLDIRNMGDSKQSIMGTVALLQTASLLLAIVSILLLILSIYSGISMDVVNRQKEVAIRKINGATPKVIALLFGKIYLIIYLSVFVIIYPLVRLVLIGIAQKSSLKSIYSWNWGILLFFTMALLIFLVTAYKIYKVMHLNPGSILKKE
ncbi:ABC transporter permease [Parabacteroides johnsonii]|uniref:ABC transporter permease n=1 Tax=Parabacteroides johnsonii TaxID=387661 RepID=UPI0011DCF324|nr:ABC transporter permease [Parabacteroides johnsonii]